MTAATKPRRHFRMAQPMYKRCAATLPKDALRVRASNFLRQPTRPRAFSLCASLCRAQTQAANTRRYQSTGTVCGSATATTDDPMLTSQRLLTTSKTMQSCYFADHTANATIWQPTTQLWLPTRGRRQSCRAPKAAVPQVNKLRPCVCADTLLGWTTVVRTATKQQLRLAQQPRCPTVTWSSSAPVHRQSHRVTLRSSTRSRTRSASWNLLQPTARGSSRSFCALSVVFTVRLRRTPPHQAIAIPHSKSRPPRLRPMTTRRPIGQWQASIRPNFQLLH